MMANKTPLDKEQGPRDKRVSTVSDREGLLPKNQRDWVKQFIKEKENKRKIMKGEIPKIPRFDLLKKQIAKMSPMSPLEKEKALNNYKVTIGKQKKILNLKRSVILIPDPKNAKVQAFVKYKKKDAKGKIWSLGKGASGTVIMGEDLYTRKRVAIKEVIIETDEQMEEFQREAELSKKAGLASYSLKRKKTGKNAGKTVGYLVMHLGEMTLAQYCEKNPNIKFDEKLDIAISALKNLILTVHDRGVLHKDIKPTNMLIDPKTRQIINMDLGLGVEVTPLQREEGYKSKTNSGTPFFMAPELYQADKNKDYHYSEKTEIFAMGESCRWLFNWEDQKEPGVLEAFQAIAQMLHDDPNQRPLDEKALIDLLEVKKIRLLHELEKNKKAGADPKILGEISKQIEELNKDISQWQKKLEPRLVKLSLKMLKPHFENALSYNAPTFRMFRREQRRVVEVKGHLMLEQLKAAYQRDMNSFKFTRRNEPSLDFLQVSESLVSQLKQDPKLKATRMEADVDAILKDVQILLKARNPQNKTLSPAAQRMKAEIELAVKTEFEKPKLQKAQIPVKKQNKPKPKAKR